jgi:nitroimidazol reductase NimA-like FMN-containing flavoprotein (pyridoxamine 5'-phosphate oxidase superfamily)
MRTIAVSQQECEELLQRITVGRLACSLDNQPYVVPVGFSYEPGCVYIFSTLGKRRLNACGRILKSACKPTRSGMIRTG